MILGDNPGVAALVAAFPETWTTHMDGDWVQADSGTHSWWCRSEWIGEGFPSDLQRLSLEPDLDNNGLTVVTARRISPGTKQELLRRGLSWADLTGRCVIQAPPGLYIERSAPRKESSPPSTVRWADSTGAVAEALLHLESQNEDKQVHAMRIAELTGYSYPQTNKVLQQFDAVGYLANVGTERGPSARRELTNPSRLLSDWAGWYKDRPQTTVELQPLWRATERSIEAIKQAAHGRWATTGWIAAEQLAPLATAIPNVTCYIDQEQFEPTVSRLLHDPDVELVREPGRISLIRAEPYVLRLSQPRDLPTVSNARIYGDLLRIAGRGDDAAQHFREVVIGY